MVPDEESPVYAGATRMAGDRCLFKVWAPLKERVEVLLHDDGRRIRLQKKRDGYFSGIAEKIEGSVLYSYILDDGPPLPDPASAFQPQGIEGPSAVVDHDAFNWTDHSWKGVSADELILYELHVGTFTEEGTFDAIIPRLDELYETGINAIQLLPVSQFSGGRNWGYDGVFPYAVQNTYGGPDGLKRLVNACHNRGIAVILDVVYNHIGPEGNVLDKFGPYFTDNYKTPWGKALNFDGEWSDGVRTYFSDNPIYWFEHYHLDGLRLDAIHMVYDNGAVHFWQETNDKVAGFRSRAGRPLHMIAESDLNSPRVVSDTTLNGYGFSAQWLDDFHHSLYVMLDDKGRDRYIDFGKLEQLAKAYNVGFVHTGEFVRFRKRRHGASSAAVSGDRFVVFNLNHDQVGNRPNGERLCVLVDFSRLKLAAAAIMLSPYIPMLFMGEEYADENPFYYFVSHRDPDLIEAVRKGRKEEFKDFPGSEAMPDPQDEDTFNRSKLDWSKRRHGRHKILLEWHKKLIDLRRQLPALRTFQKHCVQASAVGEKLLILQRQTVDGREIMICLFNFSNEVQHWIMPSSVNTWNKILDSTDSLWSDEAAQGGPGSVNKGERIEIPALAVLSYSGSHH